MKPNIFVNNFFLTCDSLNTSESLFIIKNIKPIKYFMGYDDINYNKSSYSHLCKYFPPDVRLCMQERNT